MWSGKRPNGLTLIGLAALGAFITWQAGLFPAAVILTIVH